MRIVLLTNDPATLSFAEAVLKSEGIPFQVLDALASAADGSIGAIPRRLVVGAGDEAAARQILNAVGIEPSHV